MKQPSTTIWSAIVALIICGSAGISIYKGFADAKTTVENSTQRAVQEYRRRPEIEQLIASNAQMAATIEQHREQNKASLDRGGRGDLYNDKITNLNAAILQNNRMIAEGERAIVTRFEDARSLTQETSVVSWAGKLAISITMPLCAWLLALFSTRCKQPTLANIQFVLSFVCEIVSAYVMHDGILIMLNDDTLAKLFSVAAIVVLPFVYKGIASYAFSEARSPQIEIFSTEDLPPDPRQFCIFVRQGRVSPDLSIKTVSKFYRDRGINNVSEASLWRRINNGAIDPLNSPQKQINQEERHRTNGREG